MNHDPSNHKALRETLEQLSETELRLLIACCEAAIVKGHASFNEFDTLVLCQQALVNTNATQDDR